MNLLEHYILKIYGERQYVFNYLGKQFYFVEVEMIINCYGNEREVSKIFNLKEWQRAKNEMCYLA